MSKEFDISRRGVLRGLAAVTVLPFLPEVSRALQPEVLPAVVPAAEHALAVERAAPYGRGGANQVILRGTLTKAPQLTAYNRADGSTGYRLLLSVATANRLPAHRTTYSVYPVLVWGQNARRLGRSLRQKDEVLVAGEAMSEERRKRNGTQYSWWHIHSSHTELVSGTRRRSLRK